MVATDDVLNRVDPSSIRAIAFDCYGTLIDFDERAFAPAMHDLLEDHGIGHVQGESVWEKWMESARAHGKAHGRDPDKPLAGPEPPFFSFAEVWPQHFEFAFEATKVDKIMPRDALQYFFGRISEAPPYDDVHDVLDMLRAAGMPIVVASNADDVHLRAVLQCGEIETDAVISSEGVRSYKPRRPFFDAIGQRLHLPLTEILYVGDSPYADIVGARNAGMPVYWVKRYEDPDRDKLLNDQPDWTYTDLRGLLEIGLQGVA